MCSYCWSTYSGSSSGSTWTSTRPVFVTSPHIIFMGIPLPLSPAADTHHAGCALLTEHGVSHDSDNPYQRCDCRCHETST